MRSGKVNILPPQADPTAEPHSRGCQKPQISAAVRILAFHHGQKFLHHFHRRNPDRARVDRQTGNFRQRLHDIRPHKAPLCRPRDELPQIPKQMVCRAAKQGSLSLKAGFPIIVPNRHRRKILPALGKTLNSLSSAHRHLLRSLREQNKPPVMLGQSLRQRDHRCRWNRQNDWNRWRHFRNGPRQGNRRFPRSNQPQSADFADFPLCLLQILRSEALPVQFPFATRNKIQIPVFMPSDVLFDDFHP